MPKPKGPDPELVRLQKEQIETANNREKDAQEKLDARKRLVEAQSKGKSQTLFGTELGTATQNFGEAV